MSTSAESVRFDEDVMWVALSDGRVLGVPLAWFPRLLKADAAARAEVEINSFGLHWEALDEDVSVEGLLEERGISGGLGRWLEGEWWVDHHPTLAVADVDTYRTVRSFAVYAIRVLTARCGIRTLCARYPLRP